MTGAQSVIHAQLFDLDADLASQRNVKDILHAYFLATHYDPTWYKAWHTWALANFEVIGHLDNQTENKTVDIPGNGLAAHIVQAVQGGLAEIAESICH
jgi:FKBP12-rapamycin complex-associated protein